MDKREFSSIESCLVEHLQRSGQLRQLSIMRLFMHWKDVVGILVAKIQISLYRTATYYGLCLYIGLDAAITNAEAADSKTD